MLKPEDVAAYLKDNPAFFDTHGELFSGDEETPTPFHERQITVLRQRHQAQVARYDEVVDSARNNQALEQSLHELALALLCAPTRDAPAGCEILCEQFDLAAAQIVNVGEPGQPDTLSLLQSRVAHGSSVCDDRVSSDLLQALFGDRQQVGSCAFVPLISRQSLSGARAGNGKTGNHVLVLGATDAERFQPGLGSIYLDRVGQLVAAFLSV